MDKREFGLFASALRTYYPREALLPNQQAMELWFRELKDIPYEVAEASLRKWVSTNKWSPSIAEIRATASNIRNGEIPDWGEGWNQVLKAIKRYGMYNVSGALDSLDPLTRQCVERLGFKEICLSENIGNESARFRMLYEQLAQRQKTEQQIALPLQKIIHQLQLESKDGFLQLGSGGASDGH